MKKLTPTSFFCILLFCGCSDNKKEQKSRISIEAELTNHLKEFDAEGLNIRDESACCNIKLKTLERFFFEETAIDSNKTRIKQIIKSLDDYNNSPERRGLRSTHPCLPLEHQMSSLLASIDYFNMDNETKFKSLLETIKGKKKANKSFMNELVILELIMKDLGNDFIKNQFEIGEPFIKRIIISRIKYSFSKGKLKEFFSNDFVKSQNEELRKEIKFILKSKVRDFNRYRNPCDFLPKSKPNSISRNYFWNN